MNNRFNTKYSDIITSEKFHKSDISLTAIFALASEAERFFGEIKEMEAGTDANPVRELNVYLLDRAIMAESPHFEDIRIRIYACSFACQNSRGAIDPEFIPAGLSTLRRLIGNADGVVSAGSVYPRGNDRVMTKEPLDIIYSTELLPELDNLLEPLRTAAGLAPWYEGPTRLTYIDVQDCCFTNDPPDLQTRTHWINYINSGIDGRVYFFSPGPPPRINGLDNNLTEIWSNTRPPDYPGIPIYLNRTPAAGSA